MNRRVLAFQLAAAAIAVAGVIAVSAAAFTNVTFIFKNGQRLSGEFSYHHDTNYNLIINGQERKFPSDDIALIAFVPGDPPAKEILDLSTDAVPLEHDRHMLAFRNGRTLRGKIYDFQGDNILIDARDGSGNIARQTFAMDLIARLYVSAPASRDLFPAAAAAAAGGPPVKQPTPPNNPRQPNPPIKQGGGAATATGGVVIQVTAKSLWTDTGIDVNAGERIAFSTSDQIHIDPRIVTGPEGNSSMKNDNIPVKNLGIGALIGRVGRSANSAKIFGIGGNTQPIAMPIAGRLYLGVNDNRFDDNSGAYAVRVVR